MKKRPRKSTWLCATILVYVTVVALCFLPSSTATPTEKWLSGVGSYVLVFLLWIVMRKKEKLAEKRSNTLNRNRSND